VKMFGRRNDNEADYGRRDQPRQVMRGGSDAGSSAEQSQPRTGISLPVGPLHAAYEVQEAAA
jgi:hypothetical protein